MPPDVLDRSRGETAGSKGGVAPRSRDEKSLGGPSEARLEGRSAAAFPTDLTDLRLVDARGREVPYALRVRHEAMIPVRNMGVIQAMRVPELDVDYPVKMEAREPVKTVMGPGSAWVLAFGGRVPINRVVLNAGGNDFSRPYQLWLMQGDNAFEVLAEGQWQRSPRSASQPLEIRLNREVRASKLRFVVTDSRNQPLELTDIRVSGPARQLIFPAGDWEGPLKLYVGKTGAEPPRYDFADNLPALLKQQPTPIDVSKTEVKENPNYEPPALSVTERYPWLVYLVLGTASLALLGILAVLAQRALKRTPAPTLG